MKRLAFPAFLLLTVMLSPVCAQQEPDDQYIVIYDLLQQADSLAGAGQSRQALDDYIGVQTDLQKFQKAFPDWNPKIVNFRLHYLTEKIAETTLRLPVTNVPVAVSLARPVNPPGISISTADLTVQLSGLHSQLQQLQADNEILNAKLKEALAAQPAPADPKEIVRLNGQLRDLMKENDLLKVIRSPVRGDNPPADAEVAALRTALAEAGRKLTEQTARADKLAQENQSLQTRVQSLLASAGASEALREENELLKKKLAGLPPSPPPPSPDAVENARQLAQARLQIAALESRAAVAWLEKSTLENRVQQLLQLTVNSAPAPGQVENQARIRELEQERNDLLARLGETNKRLYGQKGQEAAARIDSLAREVDTLRARVSVDEAQPVPYTPEELALFRQPEPQPAPNPLADKKSIRELPAGSATMVAEAQNYFVARQYDKAEDTYLQILRRDENNELALANLAAIELEQGKLDEAEKHLQQALKEKPDDTYSLSMLGYLRFRQAKYDAAQDALSRAAKLDPQNPEIENRLGVTLAQKGLRPQAETALRKAIQLDPNYSDAHKNLAVIYLSQDPPLVELARWHYQKALNAGLPHDPALEKMLADKSPAPTIP